MGRDQLSARQRSELMSRIRSKDTKPELLVRRLVHGMGYRYRLHAKDLPGRPDLVFRSRRKVVFVHGCFWHRHDGCRANRLPKTRREFWRSKLEGNARRDDRNVAALVALGWRVHVVWECETSEMERVAGEIRRFLGPTRKGSPLHAVKCNGPTPTC
ncbi:MAG: very short patch repair endonuclease [Chloroflexota bacterium]|nr:very short patch repair endonuclease [Chloroflexota bacterium]